ncbi:DUF6368 family protein [[Kitasatospora] papulosa]|uniref:DUF6368 family protein n=2 Tax=Streptomyces TaxID=1883 RepID=UPI0030CDF7E3
MRATARHGQASSLKLSAGHVCRCGPTVVPEGDRVDAGGPPALLPCVNNVATRVHWPFVRSPRPTGRDHARPRSTIGTEIVPLGVAQQGGDGMDLKGLLPAPKNGTEPVADRLTELQQLMASLPGMVAEVSYDTGGYDRWFRHIGDTEFLTAWLQHPEFLLIK